MSRPIANRKSASRTWTARDEMIQQSMEKDPMQKRKPERRGALQIFCSGQLTPFLWKYMNGLRELVDVQCSSPRFNKPTEELELIIRGTRGANVRLIDNPAFSNYHGRKIEEMVTNLGFESLKIGIDKFVLTKIPKILNLIEELKLKFGEEKVQKLEKFVEAFKWFDEDKIKCSRDWNLFVQEAGLGPDWIGCLEYEKILPHFGYSKEESNEVMSWKTPGGESVKESWLKWVSKLMQLWKPKASYADIVNFSDAVMGTPVEPDEYTYPGEEDWKESYADLWMHDLTSISDPFCYTGAIFWLPEMMVVDGEPDDWVCVKLAQRASAKLGRRLRVVLQVPEHNEDGTEYEVDMAFLSAYLGVDEVVRDPGCRNGNIQKMILDEMKRNLKGRD